MSLQERDKVIDALIVMDAVCDIKHYKFQVESPTSKPHDKNST